MEWNVYCVNMNTQKIETLNVFNHYGFWEDIKKICREFYYTKTTFAKEIKKSAVYFFWCRFESETVITTFPPQITPEELDRLIAIDKKAYSYDVNLKTASKIDIYCQLNLNWNHFIEYIWNNKEKIAAAI